MAPDILLCGADGALGRRSPAVAEGNVGYPIPIRAEFYEPQVFRTTETIDLQKSCGPEPSLRSATFRVIIDAVVYPAGYEVTLLRYGIEPGSGQPVFCVCNSRVSFDPTTTY